MATRKKRKIETKTTTSAVQSVWTSSVLTRSILHFLSPNRFEHVSCKHFRINNFIHEALNHEQFFRIIDFRFKRKPDKERKWKHLPDGAVRMILNAKPMLQELYIESVNIYPLLNAIGYNDPFPRLQRLSLISCRLGSQKSSQAASTHGVLSNAMKRADGNTRWWVNALLKREAPLVKQINLTGTFHLSSVFPDDWRLILPGGYSYVWCQQISLHYKDPPGIRSSTSTILMHICNGECHLPLLNLLYHKHVKEIPHKCSMGTINARVDCICALPLEHASCTACFDMKCCRSCFEQKRPQCRRCQTPLQAKFT
jgi:hypothetical protein